MNGYTIDDQFVTGAAPCAADTHMAVSSLCAYQIADRVSSTDHPAPVADAHLALFSGDDATPVQARLVDGPHRPWRSCEPVGKEKPAPEAIAPVGALRIAKAGIAAIVRAKQRFPVFSPESPR